MNTYHERNARNTLMHCDTYKSLSFWGGLLKRSNQHKKENACTHSVSLLEELTLWTQKSGTDEVHLNDVPPGPRHKRLPTAKVDKMMCKGGKGPRPKTATDEVWQNEAGTTRSVHDRLRERVCTASSTKLRSMQAASTEMVSNACIPVAC